MSDLHPSNYVFKPKTVKVMSTFGNCQRGCKFCQFTHYDESLYLIPAKEVVAQLNNVVKFYPEVQMFVFDDDDFMSRGKYISLKAKFFILKQFPIHSNMRYYHICGK